MTLDLPLIRAQFPALDRPAVFLDNPGGTQIARTSLERIQRYLLECNANHGGAFATSRASDAIIDETRIRMAEFLNASRPEEIVLGPNMTTLTFQVSRALAQTLRKGDTIVVTHLDHDANISPWLRVAEDRGCRIRWVDFHPETGSLDLEDFARAMEEKPRIAAFGYASNALGTVNPVRKLVEMAHAAGALTYIDAVQYAAHGPIDVQDLGTDFLVCSSYKFFGPHMGILYGRYDLLDSLRAYRVRPAPAEPPGKFETGTNNFECIAGILGALEYFEWVGATFGDEFRERVAGSYTGRALVYKQSLAAIHAYELELSRAVLNALDEVPGTTVYGLTDRRRLDERVATISFTLRGKTPQQIAEHLDRANIYTWNGNFYALAVTTRLGLEGHGGLLRVGAVHYNTLEEVLQLRDALIQMR